MHFENQVYYIILHFTDIDRSLRSCRLVLSCLWCEKWAKCLRIPLGQGRQALWMAVGIDTYLNSLVHMILRAW